jgi:hypothetical protein
MKLIDFQKSALMMYKQRKAVHLVGPPGVGKTDVIKHDVRALLSEAHKCTFGYADVLLPTIDAPDLRGFLVPTKDADGHPTSFFTRSAVLPSKAYLAEHPRGIMFLDERSQADMLTQKAVAPIVLDKRFGEEYLPEGWWVLSASNRLEDKAGTIRPPTHLVNRERTIYIDPDITSWAIWAEAHDVHPMMVAFAKQFPGVVFQDHVPKSAGDGSPFCTPRSFVSAAEMVADAAGVDDKGRPNMSIPVSSLLSQIVQGDIGEGACAQLFGFLKVGDQLPTIDQIEKDPMKAKCPEDLSAAYAAMQLCIHHAQPVNVDKLWTYTERLPKELQVSAAKSLVDKGKGVLLNSQALNKWIMNNRALINASNK